MKLNVEKKLAEAVAHFWRTRAEQHSKQGAGSGIKDAGSRSAVTGGKHADGFVRLIAAIVAAAGLPQASVHAEQKRARTLPGHFRPTKEWDLVVTLGSNLIAAAEVKSQVGSFGNNFNNRVEEALGNATDFWGAYEHGTYAPTGKPWLGYLFMLEEHPTSLRPMKEIRLEPFRVDQEFQGRSYAQRYELVCLRLVRERLYDAACFLTSNATEGTHGTYCQPNVELSIARFATSLFARAAAFTQIKE
jgi:hypothetical protein